MDKLKTNQDKPGFEYFSELVKHLKVVANVMVRNVSVFLGVLENYVSQLENLKLVVKCL